MGPKVLFQVGYVIPLFVYIIPTKMIYEQSWFVLAVAVIVCELMQNLAILKINGEQLLQIQDDGQFLQ